MWLVTLLLLYSLQEGKRKQNAQDVPLPACQTLAVFNKLTEK
ncbi:unnamed protein product [Tetraodon nigroviridis]|uniref:(spotted green pufferfish) hypothetical protein n=1 Tax=Tetraodon nigroviridis TaxID=99883 RepID=Q4S8U4_TETNG|nr:unnamed protein product [Tetraodon nigroviridis]